MLSSLGLARREKPYPTDTTDEQWAMVAGFVATASESGPGSKGGRPPDYDRREIIDAILYINRAGCAWRMLPHDFPPYRLVFYYFRQWSAEGTLDRIHQALRDAVRDATAHGHPDPDPHGGADGGARPADTRDPMASAGVIDSQSIAAAPTVGHLVEPGASGRNSPDGPGDARGYDAGKKINGRKRHLVVDTLGLLIAVLVTPASVQDRDGGIRVLSRAKTAMPSLVLVWADAAYSKKVREFAAGLRIAVEVVAKPPDQRGFAVLPRRWVVERTHAWLTACRRLARDYERRHTHAEAMIKVSSIGLMLRRLAPAPGRRPWSQPVAA